MRHAILKPTNKQGKIDISSGTLTLPKIYKELLTPILVKTFCQTKCESNIQ